MTIPMRASLDFVLVLFSRKEPAGWITPLVGAPYLGGITHLPVVEHWVGRVLVAGFYPTDRITLRAAF
jgi:hypothetical protein